MAVSGAVVSLFKQQEEELSCNKPLLVENMIKTQCLTNCTDIKTLIQFRILYKVDQLTHDATS